MQKKVRWGILGYAGIAKKCMIPAMLGAESVELLAIASRDREKLKDAVQKFEFKKIYENYEQLLDDPEIDAVYIPLPNSLHKEWTVKAAQKGKHILCEKPLALTEEDCKELEIVCIENKVLLMEAFMYRFLPGVLKVKEILDKGMIGDIHHIYSSHRFLLENMGDVRVNQNLGGGSLRDVGCYPVNLLGWILEDYPEKIAAVKTEIQGVDYSLAASLRYKNGVTANISCGFDGHSSMITEINGTKGSLLIRDTFIDTQKSIWLTDMQGNMEEIPVEKSNCYQLEVEEFSKAILSDQEPPLSLKETARNCRLIEEILRAAE